MVGGATGLDHLPNPPPKLLVEMKGLSLHVHEDDGQMYQCPAFAHLPPALHRAVKAARGSTSSYTTDPLEQSDAARPSWGHRTPHFCWVLPTAAPGDQVLPQVLQLQEVCATTIQYSVSQYQIMHIATLPSLWVPCSYPAATGCTHLARRRHHPSKRAQPHTGCGRTAASLLVAVLIQPRLFQMAGLGLLPSGRQ